MPAAERHTSNPTCPKDYREGGLGEPHLRNPLAFDPVKIKTHSMPIPVPAGAVSWPAGASGKRNWEAATARVAAAFKAACASATLLSAEKPAVAWDGAASMIAAKRGVTAG